MILYEKLYATSFSISRLLTPKATMAYQDLSEEVVLITVPSSTRPRATSNGPLVMQTAECEPARHRFVRLNLDQCYKADHFRKHSVDILRYTTDILHIAASNEIILARSDINWLFEKTPRRELVGDNTLRIKLLHQVRSSRALTKLPKWPFFLYFQRLIEARYRSTAHSCTNFGIHQSRRSQARGMASDSSKDGATRKPVRT